jgi:nucleotide-binding universal stress UspA family protein
LASDLPLKVLSRSHHHLERTSMLAIRKILHPTDFSDLSRSALEFASALARDYGAELVVVHVHSPAPVYAPDGIVTGPIEDPYEVRAKLAQVRPADHRVKVEHHLLEGNPADEILKAARVTSADLIVMGTHGSTGLSRLLMGSVAENVLRKAPCPVLTVRGPFAEKGEDRPAGGSVNESAGTAAPAP